MKKLLALLLILLAQPLLACEYKMDVEPQRPTSRDDVTLTFSGRCGDACVPRFPTVEVSGNRIEVSFATPGGCILIPTEWSERVHVGHLLAGAYEVHIRHEGETQVVRPLVVGSAPFTFAPTSGPGGTRVVIQGLDLGTCPAASCTPKVYFGGLLATDVVVVDGHTILATAPAHAPGLVDVAVEDYARQLHTVRNGFRYAEPGDANAEYDRVMLPLNYEGPGAAGARWNTRVLVRNEGPAPVWTIPFNRALAPGERVELPTHAEDGGQFLYVARGLVPFLRFSSHILDESRTDSTIGTEMPVVHAEDTSSEIRLLNVRAGAGYRALLRVYDFDATPSLPVLVRIDAPDGSVSMRSLTLSPGIVCVVAPCLQPGPTFIPLDLTGLVAEGDVDLTITARTSGARLWAFVSVTNNETQQVTLWTPQ